MRFPVRSILHALAVVASNAYDIGVGISDITGPAAQVTFMGYGVGNQKGEGIHFRQRARAFVVSDGDKKVAYVSGDFGMGADMLNKYVVEELDKRLGQGVYTMDNVCISGTHTHSTPGGYAQYVMVQVPSLGYIPETFQALVTGCADAIAKAHANLQPGRIKYSRGALVGSNINRSPSSYLLNPRSERDEYASIGDTDKDMLMLRFEAEDGTPVGMLNWFAVHGTSMNSTNRLISGDNRGLASMRVEALMNGPRHSQVLANSLRHLHRRIWVMFLQTLWVLNVLTLDCRATFPRVRATEEQRSALPSVLEPMEITLSRQKRLLNCR
jgi:neutral ceramidase